jgi:transcriptional regulator with XRE-family HTH domain
VTRSAFSRRYTFFRRVLAGARKRRGLTQVGLARRLGRPQSFVSKYERGERRLDVVEFLDVARALKIDPMQVITDLNRRR